MSETAKRLKEERANAIEGLVEIHNKAGGEWVRERARRALAAAGADGWYPRTPEAQRERELAPELSHG